MDETNQAQSESTFSQIQPYKLVANDGVLGFEKTSGFEAVTNFTIEVCGYVGDGGHVLGYVLRLELAVTDPLDNVVNDAKRFYLTNRQLGNHGAIIHALNSKSKAVWIAQSQKDTFFPHYVYKLCTDYVKGFNPKRFCPVKVVGKQPNSNTWVFNAKTQIDGEGQLIPEDDRNFVVLEDDDTLPLLNGITGGGAEIADVSQGGVERKIGGQGTTKHTAATRSWSIRRALVNQEFDNGEALKALVLAEQELFKNNFPLVLLAHAASSIAANYDLVVMEADGCAIPVLKGYPVSGKTTALKAVLSVFGQKRFTSEATSKYIEARQSSTTIPFGWDDASCLKTLKVTAVNSYNACGSASVRASYVPHTVPIITTNLEFNDVKYKSRWLTIPFEEINPKLKGVSRMEAERNLRVAIAGSHKSIPILTAKMACHIKGRLTDDDFVQIVGTMEEQFPTLDQRAMGMYTLLLYCTKKMLKEIDCTEMYGLVLEKMTVLVIPTYQNAIPPQDMNLGSAEALIGTFLREELLQKILNAETNDVLKFFEQDFHPTGCICGNVVAFSVDVALSFCKNNSIMADAIRKFITLKKIGCSRNLKMCFRRNPAKQIHCVHIQRTWFPEEILGALDEKLGKRKENKGNLKQAKSKNAESSISSKKVIEDEQGDVDVPVTETESNISSKKVIEDEQGDVDDVPVTATESSISSKKIIEDDKGEVDNVPVTANVRKVKMKRINLVDSLHPGDKLPEKRKRPTMKKI